MPVKGFVCLIQKGLIQSVNFYNQEEKNSLPSGYTVTIKFHLGTHAEIAENADLERTVQRGGMEE